MKTTKQLFRLLLVLFIGILVSYCSKDDPQLPKTDPISNNPETETPIGEPANLTTFFSDLQDWDTFSPPLAEVDAATGDAVDDTDNTEIDEIVYSCSTTAYSLTSTPEKIVTLNPDAEILYVGSLLQGDGHLNGIGSLAELPIRQRAPLKLTIDLLTSDNNRTVEDPSVSTVNQAIGEIIGNATTSDVEGGSDISYTSKTTYSMNQASLSLGISANYMGVSAKAKLETHFSEEKRTVTAYFVQKMFTASMVLPQYPEDIFSDEFTQDLLDREETLGRMGNDNLPVYISSIVYGRIMIYTFTSTSSEAQIHATLNAMHSTLDTGLEMDTELKTVLENAEIEVVTVGGDDTAALGLIRDNNLAEYFNSEPALSSARPISYTIRNLKDNVIAKVSETSEYNLKACTAIEPTGAIFEIRLTEIEGIDLTGVDPFVVWDGYTRNTAEGQYKFYVQSLTTTLVAQTNNLAYFLLEDGERKPLRNYDLSPIIPKEIDVMVTNHALHFDGRDALTISGDFYDIDNVGSNHFRFERTIKYPTTPLTYSDNNTRTFTVTATAAAGHKIKLYGTYQRVGDLLYD